MKPTDIAAPDYFHKVVDCQWACPAHTPVPEYIRLIAAGRYSDAYMVNWKSNVFPGNPRAHLRPPVRAGLPARPRREGAGRDLPPEARRRRLQGRHPRAPAASRPRRRTASASRWSAPAPPRSPSRAISLPLGYDCVVFDGDPQAGGMMRTQIPKFRLPETVIDEEVRLHPRPRRRVPRRQAHRQPEGAARRRTATRSSSAPARRAAATSTFPAARKRPKNIHIGIDWLSIGLVRPHHQDRQARHRARRRQHRDGLLPLLAPARRRGRQGGRALRLRGDEGVALGEGRRDA